MQQADLEKLVEMLVDAVDYLCPPLAFLIDQSATGRSAEDAVGIRGKAEEIHKTALTLKKALAEAKQRRVQN